MMAAGIKRIKQFLINMKTIGSARPSGARRALKPRLKIISGGQTGADRAALDWALQHKIPHGGWCPQGRWAEDGVIAPRYRLHETPSSSPVQRTEWNVRDSDGTVIFSIGQRLSGGSLLTAKLARRHRKPCLHLYAAFDNPAQALRRFVSQHRISVLNVAGPRASQEPRVGEFARGVLEKTLGNQPHRSRKKTSAAGQTARRTHKRPEVRPSSGGQNE